MKKFKMLMSAVMMITVMTIATPTRANAYQQLYWWQSTLFSGYVQAATDVMACTIAKVQYVAGQVHQVVMQGRVGMGM